MISIDGSMPEAAERERADRTNSLIYDGIGALVRTSPPVVD